jgi:phage-related protein
MQEELKRLFWMGSSKKDLGALPPQVRQFFGFALDFAQRGGRHYTSRALSHMGDASLVELVEHDAGGTYRAVYSVRYFEAVIVLHCFQKKSKSGVATPPEDMNIIRARLKAADSLMKEFRSAQTVY